MRQITHEGAPPLISQSPEFDPDDPEREIVFLSEKLFGDVKSGNSFTPISANITTASLYFEGAQFIYPNGDKLTVCPDEMDGELKHLRIHLDWWDDSTARNKISFYILNPPKKSLYAANMTRMDQKGAARDDAERPTPEWQTYSVLMILRELSALSRPKEQPSHETTPRQSIWRRWLGRRMLQQA